MKRKLWLKYFIYFMLLLFMIVLNGYVRDLFTVYFKKEFRANYFYIIISLIIEICIGLLLGLEHYINETRKEGKWKINLPKLILIGLPSFYFAFSTIWIYSNNQFLQKIIAYPLLFLLKYGIGNVTIFQIVFGYMVITSFYKYK